jgi:hypothetical protein
VFESYVRWKFTCYFLASSYCCLLLKLTLVSVLNDDFIHSILQQTQLKKMVGKFSVMCCGYFVIQNFIFFTGCGTASVCGSWPPTWFCNSTFSGMGVIILINRWLHFLWLVPFDLSSMGGATRSLHPHQYSPLGPLGQSVSKYFTVSLKDMACCS